MGRKGEKEKRRKEEKKGDKKISRLQDRMTARQ